ncbi:tetratricopeptide repeat protein [Bradyrhizobium sp. BR13661]|jgi:tetratricopeptide (TPR) repeat protein|uniref:tetratricopeptide repeat protein n=1 Tax=Bradyrhizobium sp. BR13661 TaxID=2940622 RepID=UPI0024733643|nr:tetratricopeptide repeat protein [Bradyrhizobium sp. BR13661]MDH6261224.1 tetratricopeptide (TPR) repeat protein [Bradyrhizobium sp. BR13661]
MPSKNVLISLCVTMINEVRNRFGGLMRKLLLISFAVVAGFMMRTCPATAQSAVDLCNRGNVDDVIAGCSTAIKQKPNSQNVWIAYHNRGSAWSTKGDYDKAIADFDQALRLNPNLASSYSNRGRAWAMKGAYDRAIPDMSASIRLNPTDAVAYRNRGTVWHYKGDEDKAIADYSESIRLDPKNTMTYSDRSTAWLGKADYDKAVADSSEAIRLDPKNGVAYSNRGLALRRKGDYDKAIADLSQSVQLNPRNAISYANRGVAWSYKGDYDKAISDLDEAIRLNPGLTALYNLRGTFWNLKGDLDRATADYREAVRQNPNYAVAQENLQLALDKKQRDDSRNLSAAAATSNEVVTPPAGLPSAGKRVALVIGNSKYRNVPALDNPARDAELFARTLRSVGFDEVVIKLNLSRAEMMAALKQFENTAKMADWAAIYFAGHGMEVNGVNYMVPIDGQMTDEKSISNQMVNMEYLLNAVEPSNKLRLVILDACRNNPYAKQVGVASSSRGIDGIGSAGIGKGLGRVEPEPGTLVVYSAKHGEFALDGDGVNSPFAEALVKRIEQKPAIEVRRLFDFVREDVVEVTRKQQQPFAYGSLSAKDDFFFLR